jgi:hypothetical protein
VCGGRSLPIGQRISDRQTIWQLSTGDEKLIPALKINSFWDMADWISYLVPTQSQELITPPPPSPHNPSRNIGSAFLARSGTSVTRNKETLEQKKFTELTKRRSRKQMKKRSGSRKETKTK